MMKGLPALLQRKAKQSQPELIPKVSRRLRPQLFRKAASHVTARLSRCTRQSPVSSKMGRTDKDSPARFVMAAIRQKQRTRTRRTFNLATRTRRRETIREQRRI